MTTQLEALYAQFMQGVYGRIDDTDAATFVAAGDGLSAAEQLGVYRGSVHASLAQALADIYPAVLAGLGDDNFAHLARDFVKDNPSRSSSLDDYGATFSAFIAAHPALTAVRYLAQVAALDWAWHRAFHARDLPPLDASRLAAQLQDDVNTLTFSLAPGAALVDAHFPLFDVWRMNRALIPETEIDLQAAAQACLVWRQGVDVVVAPANALMCELSAAFKKPADYGTKAEMLLSKYGQQDVIDTLIAALSQQWLVIA